MPMLYNLNGSNLSPIININGPNLKWFVGQRVANFALRASLAKGFYYAAACHPKL
jgi:hypothetical protein